MIKHTLVLSGVGKTVKRLGQGYWEQYRSGDDCFEQHPPREKKQSYKLQRDVS